MSPAFRDTIPTSSRNSGNAINSSTAGTITIQGANGNVIASGVVAVIFSPGSTLSGQNRSGGTQLCSGTGIAAAADYLDSLNGLKNNPYYKIEKDISQDGNLILKSGFSIYDEQFYTCLSIWTVFNRFEGTEICVNQRFFGGVEYAQSNLSFIKDNFEFV